MSTLSPALRKAAILISALDESTAEALLEQMGAEQAAKVRSALVALDDISAAEQQAVLAEFLGRPGAGAGGQETAADDVELMIDPATEAQAASPVMGSGGPSMASDRESTPGGRTAQTPSSVESLWSFLEAVDPLCLARTLAQEHPQVIAAVVSQLEPASAGPVLEHLPIEIATDVLERMAYLQPLAEEVAADLARELRQKLAPYGRPASAAGASGHLSAVLAAMDFRQRQRVILQLADRNGALLHQLGLSTPAQPLAKQSEPHVVSFRYRLEGSRSEEALPRAALKRTTRRAAAPLVEFDKLLQCGDAALREIIQTAHPELTFLALTAADERLTERILRLLPAAERGALRQRLSQPGPLRLAEIERAQHELALVASRLAQAGAIELPLTSRFAAAV